MTPVQRELARHALGLPNDQRKSYRNRFYAHADHEQWNDMVSAGDAAAHPSEPTQALNLFYLTHAGATAALNPGETLDAEDFPQ